MELRHELRTIREQAGLRQVDLARTLEVNQSTVSFVESGRHSPSMDLLEKWLRACGAALRVERPGDHPLGPILDAASGLDEADVHLVARVARALQATPEVTRVQLRVVAAAIPETIPERAAGLVEGAFAAAPLQRGAPPQRLHPSAPRKKAESKEGRK